jgi:hypothetical protein
MSTGTIISGIPMDTTANRQRVRQQLGIDPAKLPWPVPYQNSVHDACQRCGLEIWIGPETYKTMLDLIARGEELQVMCLICCSVLARDKNTSVQIITLTDKREGE